MIELAAAAAVRSWRHASATTAGILGVAAAAWLLPASIDIVSWPSSGPVRVALLAPLARLEWLVAVAAVVAVSVVAWSLKVGVLDRTAALAGPFSLLWLWTLPYLPWLPDQAPILLVFAGPIRWVVFVLAIVAALGLDRRVLTVVSDERRMPAHRAIFAASLILYIAFGVYSARALGPGGDEPHYLIISQSLLADGDLQIENNHTEQQYRAFFGGTLRPDFFRRGLNGQIYSIHAPGLPVLLLPVYALAGYLGSVVMLCVIAALAALAVFDLADRLAGRGAAVATWAGVCLTIPFVPHSWLIFPEVPAALVVAWAALWIWQPSDVATSRWAWRGLVLGLLPWLHTKYVILTAVFAAALFLRTVRRPKHAAALAAPIAISLGAWLYSFYLIYGEFNPEAPYADYAQINVVMRNIPRGLLGLLFDQKFGLLFYSPIYLLAIAGCWIMLRDPKSRYLGGVLLLTMAAFVGNTTRLYMWWGGSSAPARFLVPILPCLAPMMAVAIRRAHSLPARTLVGMWLSISLIFSIIGAGWPRERFFFSEPHGWARVLEAVQAGSPLALSAPTFTDPDWQRPFAQLALWLAASAVAFAAMLAASRWKPMRGLWLGTLGVVTFLFTAGLATGRAAPDIREATSTRGVFDLIQRYDPNRLRGLDYGALQKAESARLLELATIVKRQMPNEAPGASGIVAGPYALPAGDYELRVAFAGPFTRSGEIVVASPEGAVFGGASGTLENPTVVPFKLSLSVPKVLVRAADNTLEASLRQLEIVPKAIVPKSEREELSVRAIEPIADRPKGYIAYLDANAFPEQGVFWTRDVRKASIMVAPDGASRIILILYLGPRSGDVVVTAAGMEQTVHVPENATERVELAVPAGMQLVPISIQSSGWFRPSEVDPSSGDARRLGCQTRVTLE